MKGRFAERLCVLLVLACMQSPAALLAQDAEPSASSASATSANSISGELQSAITAVQQELTALAAETTLPTATKDALNASYRATLDALQRTAANVEATAKLAKASTLAADNTATARAQLNQPASSFAAPANAENLPLEEIRQRRSESELALAAARQAVQTLETTQRERETKRSQLPSLIAEARTEYDALEQSPLTAVDDSAQNGLRSAQESERNAKLRAVKSRIDLLTQEQATIDAESELLPAQIQLAKRKLEQVEQEYRFWTDLLGKQKQYQVETELREHRERLAANGVSDERSRVLGLEENWLELLQNQSLAERKLARDRSVYLELTELLKTTKTEIDQDLSGGRGLRSGLGLKLQMTKNRLPSSAELDAQMEAIDESIDRNRALQTVLELSLSDINGDLPINTSEESGIRFRSTSMISDSSELELLKKMKADVDQHLKTLIEQKSELELIRKVVAEIQYVIESHVVWIRNASAFRWSDLATSWRAFYWIVQPAHVKMTGVALLTGLTQRPDVIVIWLVLGLGIWVAGSRLRRRLQKTGELAQYGGQESGQHHTLWPTLEALFITLALALPPVITMAAIAIAMDEASARKTFTASIAAACWLSAIALFPMEALRQTLRPQGLAISHFGYRAELVTPARVALRFLIDIGLPMLLLWSIANDAARLHMDATLGRLIFAIGMLVLAYSLWRSLHPRTGVFSDFITNHPDSWTARLQRLWHPAIAMLPVAVALISLYGYSYTATLLAGKLYWTLWLGIGLLLVSGVLRRWYEIYRRRVQIQQTSPASPSDVAIASAASTTATDGLPLNADEVSAQSLRLIRALSWLAGLVGMVWIWLPMFPAVRILDQYRLWPSTTADGTIYYITLSNIVIAIPIIVLSFVAVRNIPGLLESVLLDRLPIERPARYAITTLASYVLALVGILMLARTLGLRWEGIQWLVAALGVGLGFGLQEIFANFISGIILLFEQPIRVGDVVTIDGTTGTVSRIHIRATTVTNHDQQELIIPNKDLITGRLINWTLTDSKNRLVIPIGVAYGTDTRRACQILAQICAQHENILVDPVPTVTFEGFGDSSLKIVVRCFLGTLEYRLDTIHQLHTIINDRFNEEGIEISFPQQDLHIRSLPPALAATLAPKPASG